MFLQRFQSNHPSTCRCALSLLLFSSPPRDGKKKVEHIGIRYETARQFIFHADGVLGASSSFASKCTPLPSHFQNRMSALNSHHLAGTTKKRSMSLAGYRDAAAPPPPPPLTVRSQVDRTLADKGELTGSTDYTFNFSSFDSSFESYYGNNIKLL